MTKWKGACYENRMAFASVALIEHRLYLGIYITYLADVHAKHVSKVALCAFPGTRSTL